MNPITEIRTHIKKAIREIDGKFNEHDNPHTSENVGATRYNKTFFVDFPNVSITQQPNWIDTSVDIVIELGIKGDTRPIEAHDSIMCDALDLALKLLEKNRIHESNFYNFSVGTIIPAPIPGNERWTKVTINATVSFGYKQER